jgi:pimeloyl-ACP methyl ester carboxylesterase
MAWANLSDVRCYYELFGTGEPLLLIPGLGGNCRVWDDLAPDLARDFTLVLVDNRGLGRSVARRKPRTLADYSTDLAELLDVLQLDRAHVLGLSLGGIIAQRFAIDHPTRVDRLVLVSCTDRFSPYLLRITHLLGHSLRRFPRRVFVQMMDLLCTAPLYLDANTGRIDCEAAERCRRGVPARAIGTQLRALLRSEVEERDYRITAPTLVVAGEHDALIPNCYARLMAEKIPESRFALIDSAGHNPMAEAPDVVLPLIARFLRTGEPYDPDDHEPAAAPPPRLVTDLPDSRNDSDRTNDRLAELAPEGRHR